jgi:hypothetical protein
MVGKALTLCLYNKNIISERAEDLPYKTFIPRGIRTFVFLNLEIENFNEKANRYLRTTSR